MIHTLLAAASPVDWSSPKVDYFALSPEIVVAAGICLVILIDLFVDDSRRWLTAAVSGFVLLGAYTLTDRAVAPSRAHAA